MPHGRLVRSLFVTTAICGVFALEPGMTPRASAQKFSQTNLVTDDQSAHSATITDPNLVNAWGMSFSSTSPFWVSNNGTGTSTLYNVNPTTNVPTKLGLTVTIPGDGSVTGQAFNGSGTNFNGDRFLFVSEDGTISGWRGALGTAAEILATADTRNIYKGSATALIGTDAYLYSANFGTGAIDVLKGNGGAPSLGGAFTDPGLPAGYAPFNIQNLGGSLFVTYALQGTLPDETAGAGFGYVDKYDLNGNFVARVASGGVLNAPWGLAIAPSSFGAYAGDLLVGNFGDGRISAYNMSTWALDGQLNDMTGNPLSIDGLWGLAVGNGATGSDQKLYFTAGPDDESHGLFGVLTPVPEPAFVQMPLMLGLSGLVLFWRRRQAQS